MTIPALSEHNTVGQQWLTRGPCLAFDPKQSSCSPLSPWSTAPKSIKNSPTHPPHPLIIEYTVIIELFIESILLPNYLCRQQSSKAAAHSCLREPTAFSTTLPWAIWRLRESKREGEGGEERKRQMERGERGGGEQTERVRKRESESERERE